MQGMKAMTEPSCWQLEANEGRKSTVMGTAQAIIKVLVGPTACGATHPEVACLFEGGSSMEKSRECEECAKCEECDNCEECEECDKCEECEECDRSEECEESETRWEGGHPHSRSRAAHGYSHTCRHLVRAHKLQAKAHIASELCNGALLFPHSASQDARHSKLAWPWPRQMAWRVRRQRLQSCENT